MKNNEDWAPVNFAAAPELYTILLVDDSQFIREQVRGILANQPAVKIIEAADGEEAWTLYQNTPTIQLIISDINMPKLDGLALLERLAGKGGGKPLLPVVMLTTENQLEKVMIGKKFGATGWLIKPPAPQDLIKVVQKFRAVKTQKKAG